MRLVSNGPATFEFEIGYHGWGMPLHIELVLNGIHHLCDGDIIDRYIVAGLIDFDELTPFHLSLRLSGKTYAHTDLVSNKDHWLEIKRLRFLSYDLTDLMHESVYWADRDNEHHDPADVEVREGSNILGQNGIWTLGSYRDPFFKWYHSTTHQGTVY